jgi:hypothetical protein
MQAAGDGYCEAGFRGPRCELCDIQGSQYFDKLEARCHDCGNVALKTTAALCVVLIFCAVAIVAPNMKTRVALLGKTRKGIAYIYCSALLKKVRYLEKLFKRAGMRYKLKALVGLYQCVSATPSVFNVVVPDGLEEYTRWINLIELPSELTDIVVPGACIGSYYSRLLVGSSWPIGLLVAILLGSVGLELFWDCYTHGLTKTSSTRGRAAVLAGFHRTLPVALMLTFVLVPSTATRVFKTFLCDRFEYNDVDVTNATRRYLYDDLGLACDSDEYLATRTVAWVFLFVWPVGVPVLYIILLHASRDAIILGARTRLSEAIAFLSDDYETSTFWWEPLEMCRKLVLTGAWTLAARPGTAILPTCTRVWSVLATSPVCPSLRLGAVGR